MSAAVRRYLMRGEPVFPFGGQLDERDRSILAPQVGHKLEPQPLTDLFADRLGLGRDHACLGHAFQDQRHVPDRHLFIEQQPQHGMQRVDGHLVGHEFVEEPAVRLGPCRIGDARHLGEDAAQRLQRQQPGKIAPDHLEQVRGQNLGRGHDGDAGKRGLFAVARMDPARRRTIDGFGHISPTRERRRAIRHQRHHHVGMQHATGLFDALDPDDIGADRQGRFVGQPDIGQDQAETGGDMIAHVGDPRIQTGARIKRHVDQIGGEFHVQIIKIENVADGLAWRAGIGGVGSGLFGRAAAISPEDQLRRKRQRRAPGDERQEGQARHQREQPHEGGDRHQRRGIPAQLVEKRPIRCALRPAARQQKRRGDRNDHRGDLRHQPVADREDRIGLERAAKRHVMNRQPHDQPHDKVQKRDQQPCDRIALHEFGHTVERSEERRFLLFQFPAFARLLVIDGTGGHVAVDGKLLARHPVKREACAHFGHARRALGDHHEVDDQKDAEDDESKEDAAAHDEPGEPLDHLARGVSAGMALADDQLGRRDVERQPQHQRCQQDRRKGREIQRFLDEKRDGEDQDGQREGRGETDIEKPGWHRQDHHDDDRHQRQRQKHRRVENVPDRQDRHDQGTCRDDRIARRPPAPEPKRTNDPGPATSAVLSGRPAAIHGAVGSIRARTSAKRVA